MVIVNRTSSNVVVFTLTERVTLSSPYFLASLKSRRTNEVKNFILSSNTGSTDRYDKFTITESVTENLTNSTVTLTGGDWWYKIYEQTSATNLNPDATTSLLEQGILRVVDTSDSYIYSEPTDTYVV